MEFDKLSDYSEHVMMSTAALRLAVICCAFLAVTLVANKSHAAPAQKHLLWGDTHLHSSYSADSYLYGNFTVDPQTAYRYAKGEPVVHPFHGARVQIDTPLDFLVVSDHAEFLGGIRQIHQFGIDTSGMGPGDTLFAWGAGLMFDYALADGYGMDLFSSFIGDPLPPRAAANKLATEAAPSLPGQERIVRNAWREEAQIADSFNQPGEFSAIIGWEWTATPGGANLHRIIFTDGDAETAATYIPYSRDDSPYPEDLWQWLEITSAATGDEFVSIPHNSNISKGFMFPLETLRGNRFTPEYLRLRRKWEPVVEATQTKGDSETYPSLSPNDPFADFERFTFYIQTVPTSYQPEEGDFVRSALRRGLQIARTDGINPYQFGLIGSTDSHTGLSAAEERNYQGEKPSDGTPNKTTEDAGDGATPWDMSASGRAAVWAQENTREAILQAFQRREVYATTGPRIVVRFDGGWALLPEQDTGEIQEVSLPTTTPTPAPSDTPVPMGGALPHPAPAGAAPLFHVAAMKDPRGANLDRIQIIKGWIDTAGESHEKIFDIDWSEKKSGIRTPNAEGVLPAVGNTVDIDSAQYRNSIGAATLETHWQDPNFDPTQSAFYYARVLEIPTPRHSLYDAVALDLKPLPNQPSQLQERAYTSPIWYQAAPEG